MKQEKEVSSDVMGLWVILTLENVHGRHWTMSMDNVHSFMKRCWKNSMDTVHSTHSTLFTHSVENIHVFHGKCPGCPWTFYRRAGKHANQTRYAK